MDIDQKIAIVKEASEEILTESDLRTLFETKEHPIAYDGFEPSGNIHIAQGLMRAVTVNKLTSTGIHFKFWVADWFAMLNNKMGGDLEKIRVVGEYFIEVWKACGMNLENVTFIWTSEFVKEHPEYWETVLKLSMNATVQRVLRCGQIMGREDSASNPSAQILYPLMQAADIHHLGADIAQLGMDQRKVNALARDIFPKIGLKAPVAVHHHMLMGLTKPAELGTTGADAAIAKKMSKSNPNSAIFMTDTEAEVNKKFNKAFCPEAEIIDNPVLEYFRYIVFERETSVEIQRYEKDALAFSKYTDLEASYVAGEIHPADLKQSVARYINSYLEPVRKHFEADAHAKSLMEQVQSFTVTR
jgi:tyrosyl-tRNA synthetase